MPRASARRKNERTRSRKMREEARCARSRLSDCETRQPLAGARRKKRRSPAFFRAFQRQPFSPPPERATHKSAHSPLVAVRGPRWGGRSRFVGEESRTPLPRPSAGQWVEVGGGPAC